VSTRPAAVAAIDIGTNTVRLLVTSPSGEPLGRGLEITRLGQGVDESGSLSGAAIERTVAALEGFRATLDAFSCTKTRAVATSAARDASNRDVFFDAAEAVLGFRPELISGAEEAQLSFRGALLGQKSDAGPFAIVDIGGGSTELACGITNATAFTSLDIGSVRLSERFLSGDPPTAAELESARHTALEALARVQNVSGRTWLAVAGTATTIAAYLAGLDHYDPGVTHGFVMTRTEVERALTELAALPLSERRLRLIEPRRGDVIVGGAIVLSSVMQHFELATIQSSETDILDGIAASLRT
jgi:exopolyphosphatase/guanosine-5'-triphosphate,3'-diphosphate pyrophosphatase